MSIEDLYALYQRHPRVSIDSRRIQPGDIFVALRGERFDGNRFAEAALEAGAAYAVVDEPERAADERCILVEDGLKTLQNLARHHRRQQQIPVIGITGSNGKTTTKELIKAVLETTYPLHCTAGNLNNHIGVPLTLLALPPEAEVAIIEMGANHQGEIDLLSRIAEPTHGLITNIGKAHLEGFGGIEGVKKGKSELYRFLAERDGVAFVNLGERFLKELSRPVQKRIFYAPESYSGPAPVTYTADCLDTQPSVRARFRDEDGRVFDLASQLPGAYNFHNILTAIALGSYFKVSGENIVQAIENYRPHGNRSEIVKVGSNVLIQDAYNANPTSMRLALDNLSQRPERTKMAILGDMLELGDATQKEHQAIVDHAGELGIRQLLLIGPCFAATRAPEGALKFEDAASALAWLKGHAPQQACILIKGSRGLRMEDLWASGPLRQPG